MTPEVEAELRLHKALPEGVGHDDYDHALCACARVSAAPVVVRRPPQSSGNACHVCGGITVQTGTCYTCTDCGETGGCG